MIEVGTLESFSAAIVAVASLLPSLFCPHGNEVLLLFDTKPNPLDSPKSCESFSNLIEERLLVFGRSVIAVVTTYQGVCFTGTVTGIQRGCPRSHRSTCWVI